MMTGTNGRMGIRDMIGVGLRWDRTGREGMGWDGNMAG